MEFSLFRCHGKQPLTINLNIRVTISDETGLITKLSGLRQQLEDSTDELAEAVDTANQPTTQE